MVPADNIRRRYRHIYDGVNDSMQEFAAPTTRRREHSRERPDRKDPDGKFGPALTLIEQCCNLIPSNLHLHNAGPDFSSGLIFQQKKQQPNICDQLAQNPCDARQSHASCFTIGSATEDIIGKPATLICLRPAILNPYTATGFVPAYSEGKTKKSRA